MLVTLAGLQLKWTGQLSRAQAEMMQNALSNSIRQFEQVIQREITYLMFRFQARPRGSLARRPQEYAADYDLWSQSTAYPGMLSRILFHSRVEDGPGVLMELPLGQTQLVPVAWDESMAEIRESLEPTGSSQGRALDPRPFSWVVFPEARALARPESLIAGFFRRGPGRGRQQSPSEHLILVVDWDYIDGTVLPDMIDRLFSGPGGRRLYEIAIAAGPEARFLYRSDPSIEASWLAAADSRRRFRLLRDPPPRGPASVDERRPGPQGDAQRGRAGGPGQGGRSSAMARFRVVVAGSEPAPSLVVAATHASGSLAGVVERQRTRNLATGSGVLVVLAGAMALLLVSARRAGQLATMQMEFIAGVTHELRTPLSVIRSVGENLADGVVQAEDQVRRYGELVRDQGSRLSQMVEKTLQFAALETGKRQFHLVSLDVTKAVCEALDAARPMIEQAGFVLERDDRRELPTVRADEGAVQQILANLLSNAVKYGQPGRWVRLETGVDKSGGSPGVQIRVRDGGRGIPASEARRVFDAYYRGAVAGEGNIQGSGLGLKLARDLAHGMGGALSFSSVPGSGTVFTLRLPAESGA